MWANMGHDPSDGSAKGGEGSAGVACPNHSLAPAVFQQRGKAVLTLQRPLQVSDPGITAQSRAATGPITHLTPVYGVNCAIVAVREDECAVIPTGCSPRRHHHAESGERPGRLQRPE